MRINRAGWRPTGSSRHTRRSSPASLPPRASVSLDQARGVKPGKSAARSTDLASPRGRLATGQRVRAASGSDRLISAPTRTFETRLLPVFVPPQTAATITGSRVTCGRSLPKSCPCHSAPPGDGAPNSAASPPRRSTTSHNSPTLPAQATYRDVAGGRGSAGESWGTAAKGGPLRVRERRSAGRLRRGSLLPVAARATLRTRVPRPRLSSVCCDRSGRKHLPANPDFRCSSAARFSPVSSR